MSFVTIDRHQKRRMTDTKNVIKGIGTVTEALPGTLFRVKLPENEVLGYLAGKMRMHKIKVLVGDRVEVEQSPYGGKVRIVKRF